MNKIIIFIMLLSLSVFAQQINYTFGLKATSGDPWKLSDVTYLDTIANMDIIIDLNDFYPYDYNPLVVTELMSAPKADSMITTSTVQSSSNHKYIGTFYANFDVKNAADSVIYRLDVFPGVYGTDSKSVAGIVWGDTLELENIRAVNDYFDVQNIYYSSTVYKVLPPEVIRIRLRDLVDTDQDDSIAFDWTFAYPALYHQYKERKPSNR